MLAAEQKRSLVDLAVNAMAQHIAEGTWPVGSRIPTEPALAETLGISRNTVREAVRVLLYAGLLEVRQGDGTYVRALTSPAEAMRVISRASLREHLEARALLEVATARLAAERCSDADLAAMETALSARMPVRSHEDLLESFIDLDLAFHLSIARACGNVALAELYQYFSQSVRRSLRVSLLDCSLPEPDHAAHAAIVEAIRARDPEAAARAAAAITAPMLEALSGLLPTQDPLPKEC